MGKLQNNEVEEVKDQQLLSFPYNRTVLIATKSASVSSESSKSAKGSKTYGTGYCLSPYFVITSRFVISDSDKKLYTPAEITVYLNCKFQDEWLCFSYEVEEIVNLSESMEKSVSVLRLKAALNLATNGDDMIGLIKVGKMNQKVEVVGMQVKDWSFINPVTITKHSTGESMRAMQSLIYYKSSTEFGFGGAPLIIEEKGKKLMIGLHFGANNKAQCNFGFCFTNDTMMELFNLLKKMKFGGRISCVQTQTGIKRIFQSDNKNYQTDTRMEQQKGVDLIDEIEMKEEPKIQVQQTANNLKAIKRLADPNEIKLLKWSDKTCENFKIKDNNITRMAFKPEQRQNYIVSEPFSCTDKLHFVLSFFKPGVNLKEGKQFFSFGFAFQKKLRKDEEPISQLINEKSFCYRFDFKEEGEIYCDNKLELRGPMLGLIHQSQIERDIHFALQFINSTCEIKVYKTKQFSEFTIRLHIDEDQSFTHYALLCFCQIAREGCVLKVKSEKPT